VSNSTTGATAQTKAIPLSPSRTGAQAIIEALEQHQVRYVFGYPGGAIMPIYDAMTTSSIKHILCRHEQGAALAADAFARVTGQAGVCMATSGPGATNLVTGIANAYMDSVPLVAITGQVARPLMGTDSFQEVDIFGITLPIVKHSFLVREPDEIPRVLAEAFQIAQSGRPGPVLVDLPKDVTVAAVKSNTVGPLPLANSGAADSSAVIQAARLMESARRPVLYAGGGISIAGVVDEFRKFANTTGFPIVATLKALGTVPSEHPQYLGMLGMHGSPAANDAVQQSDLLICIGARFDDRATGRLDSFAPNAKVIHFDADPAEISKLRAADVALPGSLVANFAAIEEVLPATPQQHLDWVHRGKEQRKEKGWRYDAPGDFIYAPALLKKLSEIGGDELILACDVGQHQMWVAQHCRFHDPRSHLTSGGLGTMGYGIPAGIGAKLAAPDKTVVTVTGDGSIMMNIQELATLKRYGIDLKIVVIDNSALGMVRQWQELFFDQNYSEVDLSDNPDFTEVAQAFGIEAFSIQSRQEVVPAIERLLSHQGAMLLHVPIDPNENVWPLVPPGKGNDQMMHQQETVS